MLRGKSLPIPAWRAVRVIARVGGAGRYEGLEPPFEGRDEELRLIKDLFHGSGDERRPQLSREPLSARHFLPQCSRFALRACQGLVVLAQLLVEGSQLRLDRGGR